jgi:hypothetical protein
MVDTTASLPVPAAARAAGQPAQVSAPAARHDKRRGGENTQNANVARPLASQRHQAGQWWAVCSALRAG